MTFDLTHWRNPRAAIATSLRYNDLAYVTHGALQVGVMLRVLSQLPQPDASLLDYGCGTGRIGRCATSLWAEVHGYDPSPDCIKVGMTEATPIDPRNLYLTSEWDKIPVCDFGLAVNVMEHLTPKDQAVMIEHLKEKVRGYTVIWYRPAANGKALKRWLTDKQRRQDEESPTSIQVRAFQLRT